MTTETRSVRPHEPPRRRTDEILAMSAERLGGRFTASTVSDRRSSARASQSSSSRPYGSASAEEAGRTRAASKAARAAAAPEAARRPATSRSRTAARASCRSCTRHGWPPSAARPPSPWRSSSAQAMRGPRRPAAADQLRDRERSGRAGLPGRARNSSRRLRSWIRAGEIGASGDERGQERDPTDQRAAGRPGATWQPDASQRPAARSILGTGLAAVTEPSKAGRGVYVLEYTSRSSE